ncbi:hypothetical protein BT63DRAFT_439060 [Microthyrium microscopicum]|uniref:Glycine-rich cell wall structural protein 1 n=1 Tax=Microthyrium microscopicum TaxID=703497 RepID=A0A6A6UFL8_9PEZI|nr:hypothetical protein BT63DRAFT_439060 [Microthyrium microscopicum]
METVNNVAAYASKAIWGEGANAENSTENSTEPVSGQQGAGTVNEPFDKGNEEHSTTGTTGTTTSTTTDTTPTTTGKPAINNPPTSGVDTSAENRSGPSEAVSGQETGDPKSGQAPEAKQQGAANPHDSPEDKKKGPKIPHTDEEREELVMSGGEFPKDPNDHSGEPIHMHGGGAQKKEEEAGDDAAPKEGKKDRSASVSQEGGNPHGKTMGTGEQVVKASGLAADGGDFDATKPGAGSEANRLLEEKGVHKEKAAAPGSEPEPAANPSGTPGKVSKMDKIKEKLHIGSKKDKALDA